MAETRADFTATFAGLAAIAASGRPDEPLAADARLRRWQVGWLERLAREPGDRAAVVARLRRSNPVVIPRNHRVEEALAAAAAGDLGVFERLVAAVRDPYATTPANEPYRGGPPPGCGPYRTFCGT